MIFISVRSKMQSYMMLIFQITYILSDSNSDDYCANTSIQKVTSRTGCGLLCKSHQGGHFPPVRGFVPPLSPIRRKKWPKSVIFSKFVYFCPLRIAFSPPRFLPQKKFLVPPLVLVCPNQELTAHVLDTSPTSVIIMHKMSCMLLNFLDDSLGVLIGRDKIIVCQFRCIRLRKSGRSVGKIFYLGQKS